MDSDGWRSLASGNRRAKNILMNYRTSALLTDYYQLTMLESYFAERMNDTAVFEFFVRRLPERRNFLVAAGLEQVLDYLEQLHFTSAEIAWLARHTTFSSAFLDYLAALRFSGEVRALPEGSIFFADEPVIQVIAPLCQAQLVESRVINLLHFQCMVASKAVRCVLAAPQHVLVDFGMRRAHAGEAGLLAARAAYIAGFNGSATVLAGQCFDIPLFGTMAHSYVQAHSDEASAFAHFCRSQGDNAVLLIDTYDIEAAAKKVVALAVRLKNEGGRIKAVRIDSGDIAKHAAKVRSIFDAGGCNDVKIFVSGNLDEYKLHELLQQSVPVDGFGVGTMLDTSADAPYLDCAYKLEEYVGLARRKRSEGKATWPGRKQLYRSLDENGVLVRDILTLADDVQPGRPLLVPVMQEGKRVCPQETLAQMQQRLRDELACLPPRLCGLDRAPPWRVEIAPALKRLAQAVDARTRD